jgi:uncharacterized protein YeaO (DUF488 family)
MALRIKRAYEKPVAGDGVRVLVDGLWPRGLSREDLRLNAWMREIAPSKELRQWYGHDPGKWLKFRERYRKELEEAQRSALLNVLADKSRKGSLTLVFGARDGKRSNAAVLAEIIREKS